MAVLMDPMLSDEQLQRRTMELLKEAERISLDLNLQTERLAAAIEAFGREVVHPLREVASERYSRPE